MKKIAAVIICVIFLCGCNKADSGMDHAISFRQKLMASQQCEFQCEITADYGDTLHTFTLACSFDKNGSMTFAVLEPQSIAGIGGTVGSDGGKLTFDDQALAFPLLADGYISPVSSPWLFMKALRGGYIQACGEVDGGYRISLNDSYEESPLQLEIWTDQEMIPNQCQMLWQGRKILSLNIWEFTFV